ncbi:methyltransferase domain-containing protein [uncultured Psychrobacter sp.]|uniref:methyltransferase domain-containing protein n=1 Tax=uncultured Psychrobacter sp. TaxID=259303 RepID=UPI002621E823|nr:methyltransferase domain-containing protein [uncultured Psychrobacter sp.]
MTDNKKDDSQNQQRATRTDRSFEPIADHFEKKVYGGLKGEIRLAVLRRDIFEYVETQSQNLGRPLRILDVGAGLAQIAIELAAQGHTLVINDISAAMLDKAQTHAAALETGTKTKLDISWLVCPYQELASKLATDSTAENSDSKFDLILCHALLEWLAKPAEVMRFFDTQLRPQGALSLCFYNPASFDYRNLIMGNFNLLDRQLEGNYAADNKKSLTPNHPVARQEVEAWLQQHHYKVVLESGLRVFHDYAPLKRGGHNDPEAVIKMELRYSQLEPYKWLGRYLHILATANG